jgi:hypothetical protein
VFAGQTVGIREVEDQLWQVSYLNDDLGYFDNERGRVEPDPIRGEPASRQTHECRLGHGRPGAAPEGLTRAICGPRPSGVGYAAVQNGCRAILSNLKIFIKTSYPLVRRQPSAATHPYVSKTFSLGSLGNLPGDSVREATDF